MTTAQNVAAEELSALAGGTPAKTTPFTRAKRYGEEELAELKEALDQGTLFYAQGKKVRQLEEEFAAKNGVPYAVTTSSGTASIHAAMIAAAISPGDEVIVSPITDMGSVVPILFQRATPVFADLDPHSYVLSPESVEAAITPKTRAILAVHLWGNSCDMDALMEIARRHNLVVIEDCAQAFGCTYKGQPIGTIGQIGCFSLNEFKHISCGDGGIVVTRDERLAKRLRLATDKCYDRDPAALVRNPRFLANNYRMTELQGAVAVAQLRKLDSIVERRRAWCKKLVEQLAGLPGITLPQATAGCDPSWWFFMVRAVPEVLGGDADKLAEALRAEGVPVGAHYIGRCVYDYPIFGAEAEAPAGVSCRKVPCPNAEAILQTAVMLGMNEGYTDSDLSETVKAFRKAVAWLRK